MVINEEEKNAFTQSVMGDSEGGGGSAVSICECEIDFNTGEVEFLEKASVLYEQKKNGVLLAHFKMNVSETAYQESYFDVFVCSNAVNATTSSYRFYINVGDAGLVNLTANNGDTHPVGYMNLDIG